MVTGRQQPRLVLVSLSCEGGQLCLNGPQMEELRVPLNQPNNAVVDCRYIVLQTWTTVLKVIIMEACFFQ